MKFPRVCVSETLSADCRARFTRPGENGGIVWDAYDTREKRFSFYQRNPELHALLQEAVTRGYTLQQALGNLDNKLERFLAANRELVETGAGWLRPPKLLPETGRNLGGRFVKGGPGGER